MGCAQLQTITSRTDSKAAGTTQSIYFRFYFNKLVKDALQPYN